MNITIERFAAIQAPRRRDERVRECASSYSPADDVYRASRSAADRPRQWAARLPTPGYHAPCMCRAVPRRIWTAATLTATVASYT